MDRLTPLEPTLSAIEERYSSCVHVQLHERSKEMEGTNLGVHFREVAFFQWCLLKEN